MFSADGMRYHGQMHGCFDCGGPLTKSTVEQHPYRYDQGPPVQLRSVTKRSCACGYYEVEIPRVGPLHEAIAQTLKVMRAKRDAVAFIFQAGPRGVEDGTWGVVIRTPAQC